MNSHLRAWWSALRRRLHVPVGERDRGDTAQNVIWIAFGAGIALLVAGIFRGEILDAAHAVVFK